MKLNFKDTLVEKTAQQLQIQEEWVDKIITWQFKDAYSYATHTYSQIEFSGFGKIQIAPAKLKRRIQEHEDKLQNIQKIMLTSTGKEHERNKRIETNLKTVLQFYYSKQKPTT